MLKLLTINIINVEEVTHGPGPPAKGRKQTEEKMPFKIVVQAKEADEIISQVFGPIISTVSKWLKNGFMEK